MRRVEHRMSLSGCYASVLFASIAPDRLSCNREIRNVRGVPQCPAQY